VVSSFVSQLKMNQKLAAEEAAAAAAGQVGESDEN